MEARDLFDLRAILAAGRSLGAALAAAREKDASADPATLAWVLSGFRVPPTAALPAGATAAELLAFRDRLVEDLVRRSIPGG